jgi:hypothetical protein
LLSIACRLSFQTWGVNLVTQVAADGVGLGLMIGLAVVMEYRRRPAAGIAAVVPVTSPDSLSPFPSNSLSSS